MIHRLTKIIKLTGLYEKILISVYVAIEDRTYCAMLYSTSNEILIHFYFTRFTLNFHFLRYFHPLSLSLSLFLPLAISLTNSLTVISVPFPHFSAHLVADNLQLSVCSGFLDEAA